MTVNCAFSMHVLVETGLDCLSTLVYGSVARWSRPMPILVIFFIECSIIPSILADNDESIEEVNDITANVLSHTA